MTREQLNQALKSEWIEMIRVMHLPPGDEKLKQLAWCASKILRLTNGVPSDSVPLR